MNNRGQMTFVAFTILCTIVPGILGGMVLSLWLDPSEDWLLWWVFGWMFLPTVLSVIGVAIETFHSCVRG